ncbi:MAG: HD domain-containing protein [Spirochaetaceae bacterium]|nr:HD domain-containing protein [Spirochaetaceae bacterium]
MKSEEIEDFLKQNTKNANEMFVRLSFYLIFLGPIFILLKYLNVFRISYSFSIFVILLSLVIHIVLRLTDKFCNNEKIGKFLSLSLFGIYIAILGTNANVGIYISYAIVAFLSCIYIDYKATILTCLNCYFLMLISLFVRSKTAYVIFSDVDSAIEWFISTSLGFTIEFFFVLMVTQSIARLFRVTIGKIYDKTLRLQQVQDKLIFAFADTVEFADSTTGTHIKRTSKYVKLIALKLREMGFFVNELTDELIDLCIRAAPLHDIGKISVPNNVLSKPGKFTPEEFDQMKQHVQAGYDLIEKEFHELQDPDFVKVASDMAYYHHEKWNGEGYPRGVKGEEIPICGRIMAAADVLDALLSKRQYKEAFSLEKTMEIFKESSGTHFDPCVVDAVLALKDEIAEVANLDTKRL